MNNREKILVALLEAFGGDLTNTDMQKYLFLLCQEQKIPYYKFIPYKYGCFSFQAYHDKRKLSQKGILIDEDKWRLCNNQGEFIEKLNFIEKKAINTIKKKYYSIHGDSLIQYVYRKYPYYAINSELVNNLMTTDEQATINKLRPKNKSSVLYSIGYEGKCLEEYLNLLITKDIKLLCDLRKNAISRKYGFSKKTLQNALEGLGIEYLHFPELGIVSDKRKNLKFIYDYNMLFKQYKRTVLRKASEKIKKIHSLLMDKKRIAVTCFEKDSNKCHRTLVAKAVIEIDDNEICLQDL